MSQSSRSIEQLNRLSPAERRALLKQAVRRTKESPAGTGGPKISPTSFSQQRLWFLDRFMGGSEFYNVANAVRIKGPLNIIALERSVNEIVRRHEALRTSIGLIDGNPVQVIAPSLTIKLPLIDLAGVPIDYLEVTLRKAALEQIGRPFDLSRIPLIRITLLRTGPKEHAAVMTVHHIVADGWSMAVLIRELGALYSGMVDDKPAALPELTAQYSDFAQWQRTRAQSAAIEDQMRYWKGRLAGLTPLELPIDRPRPPSLTYRGAARVITLAEDISRSLKAVSQRRGVTLFMTLLAGLQVLFSRSTGQTDIAIGSPIAGRNRPEFEDLIGFFINMLVLRGDLSGGPSFSELLGQAGRTTLEAYQHQDVPFEALVQELQPERDLARQPIFQVSFSFENVPQEELSLGTLAIEPLGFDPGTTRFEIELHAHERAGQITIALLYNTDLFDDATSARFLRHFQNLLQDAIARPDVSIDDLALFGANERHQMLVEWNDTAAGFASRCLHELFEEQAENSPDAIAIVYDHQRLTYRELNERANQLASQLRDLGAGPESIVGVHMLRSPELVIALMGVLKSGAAYLPLDPEYPPERLKFMLADAGALVVLTQTPLTERAPAWPARVIYQDALGAGDRIDRECPRSLAIEDNLAYVIYTSGSTGAPKAAMNTHRAVSNRLFWMQSEYRLTRDDCVLQKTPFSFDVSVWEFFWPLLNSARLVLAEPDGHRDRDYLVELINREQVTTIHFVPSMLSVMLEGDALSRCGSLKRVFCSGEELPVELHDRFLSCLKAELHNLYGPTEAAVDVTFSRRRRRDPLWRVPIGSPVANTQIQLLHASRHSVAIGVAGELHIGGVQVGRGYLNRPDLTAEKFIPEVFSEAPGERLYKTGDLARYLPDGRIEFLGRTDQQVKIRGHRIELQEIENLLKQHPSVREAAVVVKEGEGQKRLVAYLAANSHPDTTELRAFAGERLPEYMIPSAFFFVDALPVTTSGKLDRRALAGINIGSGCARDYAPPSTPQEKTLCGIWAGVLRLKRVGVHDNFFELGGDSIISIQIIDRANREGLRLTPRQLFQHQTVAELAAAAGLADLVEEEQGPVIGEAPLTPIQKRFFDSLPFNPNHYNQALLLEAKLDPQLLGQAISFVIQHHDALRLRFRHEGGQWSQFRGGIPEADSESTLAIVDLSDVAESERSQEIARRADELQQSLELESGSLIRAAYFRFREDQPDRLLLIIHHLAVDGVSWRILLEDLRSVYDQLLRHDAIALPRKTTSYKRWAEELKSLADSSRLLGELEYWTQESRRDVAPLPLDEPRGDNLVASARAFRFELNEADTETLLTLLPEKYRAQVSDALAAAVASGIRTWTGASNALIDFEGHGREELVENADLSRTVGWFTSVFPVVLSLPDSDEPGELLKSVKEQLRAVPNRGAGYGVLRYLTSEPSVAARLSEVRDAEIILNYLGQFDQTLSSTGIFNMASESPGRTSGLNEQRQHLIEVTGLVINKRLSVSVTYSSTLHHAGTIERLSAAIQSSLARLAEHCRVAPPCFTPSDFSLAGLKQETLDLLASRFEVIEDIYAASPLQQGLLFHALYSEANDLYLNQLSYGIEGVLDVAAFKQAWSRVAKRHAIWRTAFVWEELEQPLQIVLKTAALNFEELDWRGFAHELQQSNLQLLLDADRRRGFDLAAPPLARLTLVRLSDRAFQFIWTHHHLISDGWSAAIVLKETLTCYEALRQAKEPVLPRPRPYRDYIAWLTKQSLSEAERYWSQALKGFTSPTPAPAASAMGARGADQLNGDNETVSASRLNASELRAFAGRHRLTVNTIVQGAWALLLGIYSDEQDVIFGATTSGRPAGLSGIDSMVGVFINTLPVRVHLPPSISVTDWLGNLQNSQAEQRQYEYSPLIQIQRWSELPPRQPLFETLIVFENYPTDESLGHGSFTVTGIQVREKTHYPLTLTASLGSNLFLQLSFDRDRIDRDAGKRLLDHLQGLLENLIAYPESRLGELNLLNEYERRQLLFEWNDTVADYRVECIHHLFDEQVSRTPDSIALCFNRAMVTFRAVNGRADLIAKRLRALGVSHGDRVAVSLQRSPEMAAALLSVMKAGAAYVPADPSYPEERLRFILEDAGVRVLLTDSRFEKPASGSNVALVPVDQLEESQDDARKHFQETARPGAEDVFSVIYTSGSTGRPKGVLESHRSFVNRFNWMWSTLPFQSDDVCCQKTSLSFVDSIWEIFGPLLKGIKTVIVSDSVIRDPAQLTALLDDERITRIVLVPSLLRAILELDPFPQRELGGLKYCFSSGETLSLDLARQFSARLPRCTLINLYGSSEIGADVTWCTVSDSLSASVPIGRPIANARVYILNQQSQPVPVGAPGKIYCGGAQLAHGYLNGPDLTAEKFLPDPFSNSPGARLYQTGDVGSFRPDGLIEYRGRADHQVKVRGFRIEMGEIEAVLLEHKQIRATAVIVRDDNQNGVELAAYLVSETEKRPTTVELREFLSKKLPAYMGPSAFIFVDALPLLPSGKVDRRGLPDLLDSPVTDSSRQIDQPIVELIAGIWQQLLNVKSVSLSDSFFDIGGHSLLATQLNSRLRRVFNIDLPLACIFDSPTLASMAGTVEAAMRSNDGLEYSPIESAHRCDDPPLSFAQERLWVLDRMAPGGVSQNLPIAVRLEGSLDIAALEWSMREVARRHESLRTSFTAAGDRPVQRIISNASIDLSFADLSGLIEAARETGRRRLLTEFACVPFQLERAPLWRMLLLRLGEREHIACLTMHHIISDGWSLGVLVSELMQLYEAARAETPVPQASPSLQYADFAIWQRNWLQGDVLQKHLSYWTRQLAGAPPLLKLPTDRPRPPVQTDRGATEGAMLEPALTNNLRLLSRAEGATLFMTLLAAFQVLMRRQSGQDDIVIGSPVSGRTRSETEGMIGCFINAVALRTDLSGNPTFKEILRQVRDTVLAAYAHQDLPFDLLVDALHTQRRSDYAPVFQVVFNFQNAPLPELVLPGLTVTPVPVDTATAKYDLTLYLKEHGDTIAASMVYNSDLFDRSTIQGMLRQYRAILTTAASDSSARLGSLVRSANLERVQSAMIDTERKQANLQRLITSRRRAVNLSSEAMVKTGFLQEGQTLPLLITPAGDGIDLASWAAANLDFVEAELSKYGAILFRGFEVDSTAAFERFARSVTPELVNYIEGSSPRVRLLDKVYTSTEYPPEYFISLHNELSYAHKWPGYLFFYCAAAPSRGGETAIADCREVLRRLDPTIVERFDRKGVRYVRRLHGDRGAGLSWQSVFETTDRSVVEAYCREGSIDFSWGEDGSLRTSQIRPALATHLRSGARVWFNQADQWHPSNLASEVSTALRSVAREEDLPINAYYGDGSPIELEALDHIRGVFRQATVAFPWKEGDVLLIDNMLVAHGRMPYTGPRKVLVAMGSPITI